MNKKATVAVATVDQRQRLCAKRLEEDGARVISFDSSRSLGEIAQAEAVLLPMPLSRDRIHLSAAAVSSDICLSELVRAVAPGALVLCGMPTDRFSEALSKRGVSLFDYSSDESFLLENAYATAEGAVCEVMRALPTCLVNADTAIVGYGRIARYVHRALAALGCRQITVYARRREARTEARLLGAAVCGIPNEEGLHFQAPHTAVFSTVPERVISRDALAALPRGAIVAELASAPGGFDRTCAESLELNVLALPSLPSRYAPSDAAEYMYRAAKRAMAAHNIDL